MPVADLSHQHLVLSVDDDETADTNLRRLVPEIADMARAPLWQPAEWHFCDRYGTRIDTVLVHPDGHNYAANGDFYCADCWEAGPDT